MNEAQPTPVPFLETVVGMHRAAIIKTGVELDVFTAVREGHTTVSELARRCGAADRGMRILCDALGAMGFLTKKDGCYGLTPDAALYLDRESPAYLGDVTQFLLSDDLKRAFDLLPDAVRRGGVAYSEKGNTEDESPSWVEFAKSMMNLQRPGAEALASLIDRPEDAPLRVLDVAASHGLYGFVVAERFARSRITGLDWAPVVEYARRNAAAQGLADRYDTISGDAFKVDLGGPYDVILLPNFLHHFNPQDCTRFLKRLHGVLADDGIVLTVEHVPNEERTEPASPLVFAAIMLATTPEGDAYTLKEYTAMFEAAGFSSTALHRPADFRGTILESAK